MKIQFTLLALFLVSILGVSAQVDIENPDPNQCYVRCVKPDVFRTEEVRVQTSPAYTRLEVVPAQYETVTERVVVKEGYTRYEFVPATFRTEQVAYEAEEPTTAVTLTQATFTDDSERVLIQPAVNRWEYSDLAGCESDEPGDCQVLCYRSYEAQYRSVPVRRLANAASSATSTSGGRSDTYRKEVVETAAQVREITIEPEYETITRRVQTQPETVREVEVEATYTTITREVLVEAGGLETWEPIDCELTNYNALPINYELGSARLTADSRRVIDGNLLQLLRDRPAVSVEISSHTDSRGSASSNQNLSERRAQAVVDYLISKGINRSRLVARGYGESRPKNRCTDGVSCTEAEHAENRRTEFRVLSAEQ